MKLAIVGSRDFDDYDKLKESIPFEAPDISVIISGGAKGADTLGWRFAATMGIPTLIFKPEWDKLGKKAGFIRNQQIVDACDMVLAFWDGKSKGTEHTISLAKKAKKPTFIVYF